MATDEEINKRVDCEDDSIRLASVDALVKSEIAKWEARLKEKGVKLSSYRLGWLDALYEVKQELDK